ncbi:hypothetical protein [Shewanella psychrotolerans]|uniref:hypothetical protein n=1 Tax=Shewanella psychrotolerans TaxID=2864206 RepID=UPI001C66077F|nr:hypothetical protein [Shewanella psychrotolerans]QYK02545.1 hypothetical protein K0I62_06245 [Shewanella psychrotolerans]
MEAMTIRGIAMQRLGTIAAIFFVVSFILTGCANDNSFDQAFYNGMVRNSGSRASNHDNQVNRDDVNAGLINMVIQGSAAIERD